MAFCMLKIHSGVSKPASKLILPNCNLSRNVLRDVPEVSDSLRWATYSALLSRPVSGYNDKISQGSGQLTTIRTSDGWSASNSLQQKCQLQGISKDSSSLGKLSVNLTELYAHDPLAILLHSRLQIHNNSFQGQQEEETNKTKGHRRVPWHSELSVLDTNPSTRCPHLHDDFANQRATFPLSAASSSSEGSVVAPFPAYHEAIVTSCTLGSLPSPPSPCQTVLAGSPLYQERELARSSLHQCTPSGNDQCRGQAPGAGSGGGGKVDPYGLPTPEQLQRVNDALIETLSNLFVRSANYKMYDPNIIFENRIRGTVTKGIGMYAMQMSLLINIGHMKHAHVRFDIIKITQHPEEGTIKVRWRIKGVKSRQALVGFLKARKWSVASMLEQTDSTNWYDGFSTFHVNSAGLVSRHVADNMMPDDEKMSSVQKTGLLGRLAVLFGLLPKAGHGNAMVGGQLSDIY